MTRSFEVRPEHPAGGLSQHESFDVVVLFTTPEATLLALQSAAKFSSGLSANIRIVVPWVVPYPLALDEPPVRPDAISGSLRDMARQADVDCRIGISLCRDRWQAIQQAIPKPSLVVIGEAPRWWEFGKRKLERRLNLEGHQIAHAEARCSHA